MGADMERYTQKLVGAQNAAKHGTNQPATNKTNTTLNNRLTQQGQQTTQNNNANPLSTNAMQSQNAGTPALNQQKNNGSLTGSSPVGNSSTVPNSSSVVGGATGSKLDASAQKENKIQVAAAVGVNVTDHNALACIIGNLSAAGFDALVGNNGNFSTVATGAAVTTEGGYSVNGKEKTSTIGAGVAVSVNNNTARANLGGSLTATTGGITADTDLTQNMDGVYRGKYGTLAVAGAASGGGTAVVAGALAIMVAQGESIVSVADGSSLIAENGAVTLDSYDKSKLNVAAMAAAVSGGSTVGVGASFALLYARNQVQTLVGDFVD